MKTKSVQNAILQARLALEAQYPVLHIVTDDYAQVEQVMDSAFFGRSWWDKAPDAYTKGEPSYEYVRLKADMTPEDLQCLTTGAVITQSTAEAIAEIEKQAQSALSTCSYWMQGPQITADGLDAVIKALGQKNGEAIDENQKQMRMVLSVCKAWLDNPEMAKNAIRSIEKTMANLMDAIEEANCLNKPEKVFYVRMGSDASENEKNASSAIIVALIEQYVELRRRAEHRFPRKEGEKFPEEWPKSCLVIYGRDAKIPQSIESSTYRIEIKDLDEDDFRSILKEFGESDPQTIRWYTNWLGGYTESEVIGILREIRARGPLALTNMYAKPVIEQKNQEWVKRHGILTYEKTGEKNKFPQNMVNIQRWLREHKKNICENTSRDPDKITKGMVLVGVPGTGKSLAAKCIAALLDLPHYTFKIADILGSYVSDSEKNMALVLEDVKRAAPCVLYIDEIEKALSGANGNDGSGGVMQRLFGQMLSFMQDMTRPVFIVATANDMSGFPTEFARNGRFDARFCMPMPGYSDCVEIMKQKMGKFFGCSEEEPAKFFFEICCGMRPAPGETVNPRFMTGADITTVVKDLWIKLDGKELHAGNYTDYEKLMRDVAAGVTMMGESNRPKMIENIAQCYCRMLDMSAKMVSAGEPLISSELFKPKRITEYQYQEEKPDSQNQSGKKSACPTCMDKPANYSELKDYDKWLFEVLVEEIDRILAEDVRKKNIRAYEQLMEKLAKRSLKV